MTHRLTATAAVALCLLLVFPLAAAKHDTWVEVASNAQSEASAPIVVLDATCITRGVGGHKIQYLLARLTDDGKVEWDKYVGNAWERQTSSVTAERLSEIQRTLGSIDKSLFHGAMGPYNVYIDTSVELQVHMAARQEEVTFSLMNPWPPSEMPSRKPMPKDVKAVVCEIDKLYAQVASVPIIRMCRANKSSE
jgi:hypothetical protein